MSEDFDVAGDPAVSKPKDDPKRPEAKRGR